MICFILGHLANGLAGISGLHPVAICSYPALFLQQVKRRGVFFLAVAMAGQPVA